MGLFNNSRLLKEATQKIEELNKIINNLQAENALSKQSLSECTERCNTLTKENELLKEKYAPILERENAISEYDTKITSQKGTFADLNTKYQEALVTFSRLQKQIDLYNDQLEINSYGLYTPRYNFESSERYQTSLQENYEKQKQSIKEDIAAICHTSWEVGGSKTEGRKLTNQYKKLMLYAFNGESDAIISKVKWNNATKSNERIISAFTNINKLGRTYQVEISADYLNLKFQELALTYEYEQKKYFEKEEQRRIKEQMREEEKVQKELERAQKEAEEEELRFKKALEKAKHELGEGNQSNMQALTEQVRILEKKLAEAHEKKERALSQAQQTKVGHIYVISNIGSFGDEIYKIGMTRRLDPLDRVRELGDASVPFQFDIHAIIYTENAPQFEFELHKKFNERRVNRINNRKEFFRVTLEEIEEFVKNSLNATIEFTKLAEAREYRETLALLQASKAKTEVQIEAENQFPTSLI